MLGPRLTSVFKSRLTALLWAGMVIWTAVDFVGFAPTPDKNNDDAVDQAMNDADIATLQQIVNAP